jgi:hypothetical protein
MSVTVRVTSIWLVVFLSFVALKTAYNYLVRGYIDLRQAALWELVVLPVGITLVVLAICWVEGRRRRS